MAFNACYRDLPVLVTGHTGFKGSWLCEWLLALGARVTGLALDPQPHEKLFGQLGLADRLERDLRGDVRDRAALDAAVEQIQPAIIFHLAAQPLVRLSYQQPAETFDTNLMGTVNLLDALRKLRRPCAAVFVTSDKCYDNREWLHAYREDDALGGRDPYSASKACAELAVAAFRSSFFGREAVVQVASARAGNVVGGGDWALDRIVPDCFRSLAKGEPIAVRNPASIRPWQHVLEPLSGYLWLAARLHERLGRGDASAEELATAFNFGPPAGSHRNVAAVVAEILKHCQGNWVDISTCAGPHEAGRLNLAIDKAQQLLGWAPTWDFERTIRETASWYTAASDSSSAAHLTRSQIERYTSDASIAGQAWAESTIRKLV